VPPVPLVFLREDYLHRDTAARGPFAASGRRAVGRDQAL